MHHLILWAGFLGAWLLVLGPVYQAVLELTEEEADTDRLRERMSALPRPEPVSRWWWLLPPVAWYLTQRRSHRVRDELTATLSAEEFETLTNFVSKARGWLYVGAGGLLIATKETWELVEGHEWPTWIFWLLLVAGIAVSLGHSVLITSRTQREADQHAALLADQQSSG